MDQIIQRDRVQSCVRHLHPELPLAPAERDGERQRDRAPHQVSLVVLHPRRADEVVLLPPPVPEPPEEVVGQEAVDRVPDYVDVDGLLHPKPGDRGRSVFDIASLIHYTYIYLFTYINISIIFGPH